MDGIVEFADSRFPVLLKNIPSPPKKLYYKGKWDAGIFLQCLAVVGTRKMTGYGRRITNQLISQAAAAGITIVSGFMYGIDAAAHKAALDAGGRTIAVMPCGIDMIHPSCQKPLYNEIIESGSLVISELEGEYPPMLWTYPRRNRIIAGLSQATLVVEAGFKSGSLITAGLARKFNRKLFTVPGPLTSTVSQGTAQLIKEGAFIITSAQDILAAYDRNVAPDSKKEKSCAASLSFLEQSIINQLQREPVEIDTLCRLMRISAARMNAALCLMQVKGVLFEEGGKFHVC